MAQMDFFLSLVSQYINDEGSFRADSRYGAYKKNE